MRCMTNIVVLTRIQHAVNRIGEVKKPENITRNWNWNEEKINWQIRNHRDGCKQNPGNSTTRTNRRIPRLIFVQIQGK